jgi:hypothetical protein
MGVDVWIFGLYAPMQSAVHAYLSRLASAWERSLQLVVVVRATCRLTDDRKEVEASQSEEIAVMEIATAAAAEPQ